ncbi:MAG: tetratricopeptide repeat protein [Acidiferrobacterales bacterium]
MSRIMLAVFCGLLVLPVCAHSADDVQTRIFQYFLAKAKAGDATSEFIVGNRYESGNGVPQDVKKAYEWYEKAAAQGNQPAEDKVNARKQAAEQVQDSKKKEEMAKARAQAERARAEAEKAAHARIEAERAAHARIEAERAARAAKLARSARPTRIVASAAPIPEPPRKPIDALAIVLGGKWFSNENATEFLPSAKTSCLRASSTEIVCFSKKLASKIGDSAVTYTVKSTISNFGHGGNFSVSYMYDVVDISKNRPDGTAPGSADRADLAVQLGWQQPGLTLQCRANDERTLVCATRTNHMLQFTSR